MVNLKQATEQDLSAISDLAKIIWNAHYVSIIGQKQVDYMLQKMYNHTSLLSQLNEQKHVFYLIEENNCVLGFLSISSKNNRDYFLHKFYIDQQQAGKGIGTYALNALIQLINPKLIELTVNRQNYKSINFYFKNGFVIDKVADFDIGDGYVMNDFVMVKKIS